MPELLLELLSEEIPARMQPGAAANLERLILEQLREAGLTWSGARSFVTPRRLALVVDELPAQTPERIEERRGPFVGAPENAIAGFLKSAGLRSVDECEVRAAGKTDYYYAVRRIAGRPTREVIAGAVVAAVRGFPWPKSMRWGASALAWVRPLESVLCLFDGAVVAVDLEAHGLRAGDSTRGHRFLAPQPFVVSGLPSIARSSPPRTSCSTARHARNASCAASRGSPRRSRSARSMRPRSSTRSAGWSSGPSRCSARSTSASWRSRVRS